MLQRWMCLFLTSSVCIGIRRRPCVVVSSWPHPATLPVSSMKRRNVIDGKTRGRPVKRSNKIAENFYASSFIYIKLLVLWALVLVADHFLEFRFEYLWPFWLFLRSVYDSFKYQGLAFSVFFICIALTSDMICFLFIPVHWLFFAASTYVWVQYVWYTDKGVCLPTVFLWLLFVYIEASIRLKEFKASIDMKHLLFHMDLCRPFAAHCIGYPVVTLGFGFKSYVGYRMRQRRQKEVHSENEYYFQFLRDSLPVGVRDEAFNPHPSPKPCSEERISSEGHVVAASQPPLSWNGPSGCQSEPSSSLSSSSSSLLSSASCGKNVQENSMFSCGRNTASSGKVSNGVGPGQHNANGLSSASASSPSSNSGNHHSHCNHNGDLDYVENCLEADTGAGKRKVSNHNFNNSYNNALQQQQQRDVAKKSKEASKLNKEDIISKLESDNKKLKIDLQVARNKENELRDQIVSSAASERILKAEISNLQVEKSVLESRISALLSTRAGEKATLSSLEKKLAEERKQKAEFQIKLENERKNKKEAANAERVAQQTHTRNEVAKLEAEIKSLRADMQTARDRYELAEREIYHLRQYKKNQADPEILVNSLKVMQEKNSQLEKSLSSETKLKMDLFSALGDIRRELGISNATVSIKDKEIFELKAKIAEMLAVMPSNINSGGGAGGRSPGPLSNPTVGAGRSSFMPSSTLGLDLPASTDLSFTGKTSSLGLSDLKDKLTSGVYNFKTNGSLSMNGDN